MFGVPDYLVRVAVEDAAAYEAFYMNELAELPGIGRVSSQFKALGAFAAGRAAVVESGGLDVLVVPVIAGLIVVQTVGSGQGIVLDARLPALGVAALLIWRRVPLLIVVLAAGGVAALLHHVAG
jgi:Lrp/AsnC ligand binding domain